MSWWNKIIGGAIGYAIGGPIGGLIAFMLADKVASNFNLGYKGEGDQTPGDVERIQTCYFTAAFAVLGHLSKVDGVVSKEEIQLAERAMAQMQLNDEQRAAAVRLFNEGKSADFDVDGVLRQLRQVCARRSNLLRSFLELQCVAAWADGHVAREEEQLLQRMFEILGFDRSEYQRIMAMASAAHASGSYSQGGEHDSNAGSGRRQAAGDVMDVSRAYAVLGLNAYASDAKLKAAYRRLMSQHHPDKLIARGMPPEMAGVATARTQEIRAAWDAVKQARGIR